MIDEITGTDGISEAMNASDEEWGEERLIESMRAMQSSPGLLVLDHVMRSAHDFLASAPQFDDMTLIVARWGCHQIPARWSIEESHLLRRRHGSS